jgi:hypothetical protein
MSGGAVLPVYPAIPVGDDLFIDVDAVQEDHANCPAVTVGRFRSNSDPFPGDFGSEELLSLVAESLSTFRTIDPGQAYLDALVALGEHSYGVTVSYIDDLTGKGG